MPSSLPRRGLGGLACAISLVVVLLLVAPARADLQPAPASLAQIWGVEVDDSFVRDLDRVAGAFKAAGVTLVADPDGLSPAGLARLETVARARHLPVFQPLVVHDATGSAVASECRRIKRTRPGSRCGVQAQSAAGAARLALAPEADVVVVRTRNARSFARLDDAPGSSRMVGILRLTEGSYRAARWRGPIVAARRGSRLDLVVRPSGRGSADATLLYLRQLRTLAGGDRQPPTAPKNLSVLRAGPASITLGWSASRDNRKVAGYGLYRDGVLVGSVTGLTATFDTLSCAIHLLEVDAFDQAGNRSAKTFLSASPAPCEASPPEALTPVSDPPLPPLPPPPLPCVLNCPDTTPPSQPGNLRKAGGTQTSVTLAWSASTDDKAVTGYRIFRDGTQVATTTGTSTTVGSLACGTSYLFAVDARDAAGNASSQAAVRASTSACPDTQPPSVPPNQRYTSITRTSVTLAWDAASDDVGVAGYHLYLNGSGVASTQSLSHTFSGLSCGTSYTFALEAYDAAGNVSDRAYATGTRSTQACEPTPDTQAPTAPGSPRISGSTTTSVTLAWDAAGDNTGVSGYRVFRDGTSVATTSSLSHTFSGLNCDTTYTFAVEAYDAAGNTSPRVQVTRATDACGSTADTQPPSAPGNQRFTGTTATSVTMAWDAATDNAGVAGYRVYRDGALQGTTQSLSHTFGGLTCGTSYGFAVEAHDAAGNTSTRAEATRTTDPCNEPQPSSGQAHLWIDGDGGSCTRSATPVAYNDAAACGSASQAYGVANSTSVGSTILIRGGTYDRFNINGSRSSSNRIVFDAAPGESPVFRGGYMSLGDGDVASSGPDYVTLKNLTMAQFGSGYANPDNRFGIFVGQGSTFVRLEDMRAGNFLIQAAQNIEVIGGEYGPCRASDSGQPCEINKVDHYPGAPQPRNILIDGVHFHDYDLGPSCFKPADGGDSRGEPDCHWRSMYLNGVHDVTLRNSRFRESFIAPWMTISGPDAARVGNKNVLIENNVFGTGVNYGNPGNYQSRGYGRWEAFDFAWCQNASSGVMGYENVTFRFNSSSRAVGMFVLFAEMGCQNKVRDVRSYGNIGFRNGCDPLVEYRYNVYSNAGTCNTTDRNVNAGGALPFYASDTHSPGPNDYALTGPAAAPDNLVPVGMGCPATDRTGRPRGAGGFCDAGAYER